MYDVVPHLQTQWFSVGILKKGKQILGWPQQLSKILLLLLWLKSFENDGYLNSAKMCAVAFGNILQKDSRIQDFICHIYFVNM